jgi:hypothetical protein
MQCFTGDYMAAQRKAKNGDRTRLDAINRLFGVKPKAKETVGLAGPCGRVRTNDSEVRMIGPCA